MTFLTSLWALGLLALLPAIVVLYLLKLKRKRVVMPSTLLWRRSVQDMVANAPFQKLRNNLLMWLQLLALLLLIIGFLRPVMELAASRGERIILLVDNSASMQVIEEDGSTRLDEAKRLALETIDGMSASDEALLMTFGDRTNVVQTMTSDRGALRTAINAIEAADVRTSLAEAGPILLGLTTRSVDNQDVLVRTALEDARTIVFSDGAADEAEGLRDVPQLEYVQVGQTSDNVGIAALDVREFFADNIFERQVFASVVNASDEARTVFAELRLGDEVIDFRSVDLEPRSTSGVVFRTGDDVDGVAQVILDVDDALEVDNRAQVLLTAQSEIDVLLVTRGNPFLERVFLVDPRVRVSVIRPTDYTIDDDEFDLVVFEDAQIGQLPPGNFMFIDCVPPLEGFAEEGEPVENPMIIDWNRVHPLTRFANFDEVRIASARRLTTPSLAIPIIEAVETPLIVSYETETQKVLVIGFDVLRSTWPLDVSFPIFIANALDYLGRGGIGSFKPAYAAGETIPLRPVREASSARVTTPAGDTLDFSFEGVSTAYLTDTDVVGLYSVAYDSGQRFDAAVNLLSERESQIAPREALEIGGKEIVAAAESRRGNREIWHWFVLAGLAILLVEWGVYCKRTFM